MKIIQYSSILLSTHFSSNSIMNNGISKTNKVELALTGSILYLLKSPKKVFRCITTRNNFSAINHFSYVCTDPHGSQGSILGIFFYLCLPFIFLS